MRPLRGSLNLQDLSQRRMHPAREVAASTLLASVGGGSGEKFPIFIAVTWAVIVYCLTRMGTRLNVRWYLLPLVFGMVALTLDMALDPLAAASLLVPNFGDFCYGSTNWGSAEGVGYWVWCVPQSQPNDFWLGVPIQNFYAWFMVVAVYMYFQSIAYQRSYNSPWTVQVATLFGSTLVSVTIFFTLLEYFINLGYQWGWWIWGVEMAAGLLVVASAGLDRTRYKWDWWAYIVVLSAAVFCVFILVFQLWGKISLMAAVSCILWVIFTLLVSAWILVGKRLLGRPYP